MNGRRASASEIGRVAAVVRRHFADPTFYATRYRLSRSDSPATTSSAGFVGAGVASVIAEVLARSRSHLLWLGTRHESPPNAFERWIAYPALFTSMVLIGSIVTAASFDTPRTASIGKTLVPAGGVILIWGGLLGAMAYAEQRWPGKQRSIRRAWLLVGLAAAVAGIVFVQRAISLPLVQMGVWSIVCAGATLLATPPTDGDA